VTCNNNAPILQRDADFMHIVDADNLDVALISATTFGVQMPTWSGANLHAWRTTPTSRGRADTQARRRLRFASSTTGCATYSSVHCRR